MLVLHSYFSVTFKFEIFSVNSTVSHLAFSFASSLLDSTSLSLEDGSKSLTVSVLEFGLLLYKWHFVFTVFRASSNFVFHSFATKKYKIKYPNVSILSSAHEYRLSPIFLEFGQSQRMDSEA